MPRSLIDGWLICQYRLYGIMFTSHNSTCSIYIKVIVCILILYFLNLLFGFKSYYWSERSFEDEYHLTMNHIDITKIENNPEDSLGPPKNILSNKFLIENEYLCGRSRDPETRIYPHLLILVKSSIDNSNERQAIRMTWANKHDLEKHNIQVAFVLGTSPHATDISEEIKRYGDIILIDKMDYYYYSSYKMIMMLRWITEHCTSTSRRSPHTDLRNYVLFVDDDYYLDLNLLVSYMYGIDEDRQMTTYERRTFVTGNLIERSRPRRFLNDRWYVSLIDYPYDRYPPYISSECFLMTRYNARLFYIASKFTRLFHFDFVYMGLLSYSMSTKLIENNQLFSTSHSQSSSLLNDQNGFFSRWKQRFFNQNLTKKSICNHGYRGEQLIQLWNQIHRTNLTLISIN